MYRTLRAFLYCLCFASVFYLLDAESFASEKGIEEIHNLNQAFYFTYYNNPSLRAERADLRATQEEYPQAFSNFLPNLSWNTSYEATNVRGDGIDGDIDGAATKELGFSINQSLYRGGRSWAEVSEALNNIYAAEANLVGEEQGIFQDVVSTYMNLSRDRVALELQKKNEEILANRLENSKARFEAGEVTKTDVSQSRARYTNAKSDRLDAEVDLNSTRQKFINLTGLPPAQNLETPSVDIGIPANVEEIIDVALNNNPEIIQARFEFLSAKENIKIEYGSLLPEISLAASYTNELDPGPGSDQQRIEEKVTLRANFPFFQGGVVRSEVREAKIKANQKQLEMMQVIRNVTEDIHDSWKEYRTALEIIDLRFVQVEAAEEARNSLAKEVQAGERTLIDLLDADQDLLDAELNLILAERNVIIEGYNLLVLMGKLNADELDLNKNMDVYPSEENFARISSGVGYMSFDVYEDTRKDHHIQPVSYKIPEFEQTAPDAEEIVEEEEIEEIVTPIPPKSDAEEGMFIHLGSYSEYEEAFELAVNLEPYGGTQIFAYDENGAEKFSVSLGPFPSYENALDVVGNIVQDE